MVRVPSRYVDDGSRNYILEYNDKVIDENGNLVPHGCQVYIYIKYPNGQEPYGPYPGKPASPGKTKHRVPCRGEVKYFIADDDAVFPTIFYNCYHTSTTYFSAYDNRDNCDKIEFTYIPTDPSNGPHVRITIADRPFLWEAREDNEKMENDFSGALSGTG